MYHLHSPTPRVCAHCGEKYVPKSHNAKYCGQDCNDASRRKRDNGRTANYKLQHPDYWREYNARKKRDSTKRPPELKPPYNSQLCQLCKQPLGKTWNLYFHSDCHGRITKVQGDNDTYSVGGVHSHRRQGA